MRGDDHLKPNLIPISFKEKCHYGWEIFKYFGSKRFPFGRTFFSNFMIATISLLTVSFKN